MSTILDPLARGEAGALAYELTAGQAADLLGVSTPFVDRLLDRGEIPCRTEGPERRIAARDLFDFEERNEAARLATLRELTDLSQELGLYWAGRGRRPSSTPASSTRPHYATS